MAAAANRPIDYPNSDFLLAQLSRGSTTGVKFVNGALQAITPAEAIATRNHFSLFAQIKHFFGYGEMGYLSIQKQIERIAYDDVKNLIRVHGLPLLPPSPTIQQYCDYDSVRAMICMQVEAARKTLWTKIESNHWNQHSALSRVVISVQEFFSEFWKEFSWQARFGLYHNLGIRFRSDDPFVLQTGIRKLTGTIERRNLAGPLEPITVTMEHTHQKGAYSEYVFLDNQPYGGSWGMRGGRVEVTTENMLTWSHNVDAPEALKQYVIQATGAMFVSRAEFNARVRRGNP